MIKKPGKKKDFKKKAWLIFSKYIRTRLLCQKERRDFKKVS